MQRLANQSLYDKYIKSADKSFDKERFAEALTDYKKAQELLPDEAYPGKQIDIISQVLNKEQNFADRIKEADLAFNAQQFSESKNLYNQALEIHNDDKHALDRLKEIETILAGQQTDERYNGLVAEADNLLSQKNYDAAIAKYNDALAVKSKESYPKEKIAEINSILQGIAQANQKYEQTISKADNLFADNKFTEARAVYTEAGAMKPAEAYPKEMLAKIEAAVQEQARALAEQQAAEQKRQEELALQKDNKYQQTVDEADRLVKEDELIAAVGKFREALEIKPQEQYPIVRIEEIRGMISRRQEAQKAYEEAIAQADKAFKAEDFEPAKTAYNTAKQAKSDETYPDEMIAKIDSIVTERARLATEAEAAEQARLAAVQAEKDRQYNEAIAQADEAFNGEDYENARTDYRSALNIKPEETYPQQQIDKIGDLMAQLSAAQKAYEEAIAQADKAFKAEEFEPAKTAYSAAKQAKSDETYPDEMLAKIDSIVTERARLAAEAEAAEQARLAALQAEKDRQYNEAIVSADEAFQPKEYENARTAYRSALNIKPEETYPQQQIDKIGDLMAQLSAAQKAYEEAIAQADKEFKAEDLNQQKQLIIQPNRPNQTKPTRMK